MAKSDEAKRLLRAMSNVDDKYIEEAMEKTAASSRRAAITGIRRYSGIISAVAAAALVLLIGGALMGTLGKSTATKSNETVAEAAGDVNEEQIRSFSNDLSGEERVADSYDLQVDGVMPAATEAAAEEEGADAAGSAVCESLPIECSSLEELTDRTGFDFDVPSEVDGSASCAYLIYECGDGSDIAEVQYLDEEGNIICTVRKASGDRNISGCDNCYSVERRVEIEGDITVSLAGAGRGYSLAYWTFGDYSYSVYSSEMIPEEDMLELVSQVS